MQIVGSEKFLQLPFLLFPGKFSQLHSLSIYLHMPEERAFLIENFYNRRLIDKDHINFHCKQFALAI